MFFRQHHGDAPSGDPLDISRLPGLGRKVIAAMRAQGIDTCTQLAALSVEALDAIPGIGVATARRLLICADAFIQGRAVWLDALPELCRSPGFMFDLETEPDTAEPWSLGWSDLEGQSHIAVVADEWPRGRLELPDGSGVTVVPSNDAAWEALACSASSAQCPIYHWTGYDSGIMHRFAPDLIKEQLASRMHDLHATFRRSVILPQKSTSLKPVARFLGFDWPEGAEGGLGWWIAYRDYLAWRYDGDLDALARACRYQRADVDALTVVWRFLQGR